MTLIDRKREPSAGELRWFGLLFACFFGLIGALAWWKAGLNAASIVLWAIGLTVGLVYYALPPLRRTIYLVWMTLVFPIGWTVSHLVLAGTYYLVLTPIGWAIRLVRDPMQRRFDSTASTYWIEHDPGKEPGRYFRQF